ncbi:alpha/beta hydrolase [Baekduia soli]|uniref:Alpha/beta hydrolase n=1 Tax=Baekduia soli TaxID=496014 RepID=A0A5B8U9A3_9ACTN|nr:alpha/beta hydrolase [Baekduia soli]QEC49743.1 alpha/beta hydrolase [Baekduia soli]
MTAAPFHGFAAHDVPTPRGDVHARIGGSGPPLLLLHGFPQTHLMWHAVAPRLAERFTIVAADLPGYGDSFRPEVAADHAPHAKRALAADLVAAMAGLGHDAFAVAGHDRGGRVAYRMALDHPEEVRSLVVLDIVPTGEIWARADDRFALGYWHWPFLAQPAPLPERMILGDPGGFWIAAERMGIKAGDPRYPAEVVAAYRAQVTDPATVTAICEDYRAGATVDRAHDDADLGRRTIACPVHVLWGAEGALPRFYGDPVAAWRALAPQATGHAVPGASHFLVEDEPEAVAGACWRRWANAPRAR